MARSKSNLVAQLLVLGCMTATAAAVGECDTWYETTTHGSIFRNVKTYGAVGDGITDDTAALKRALTENRNEQYQIGTPAIVYFPAGTYRITDTLPHYFNTYVVGNYKCRPTIYVAPNTPGWNGGRKFMMDAQTLPDDGHTNNFYHSIAHVDFTVGNGNAGGSAIRWSVSQASYLRDIQINLGGGDVGIAVDNGSPTFFGDVVINGGNYGMILGSQQYALRNITIAGSRTACFQVSWAWEYLLVGMHMSNCPIGIDFKPEGQLVVIDSDFTNTPTAIQASQTAGIFLDRVTATNVQQVVPGLTGKTFVRSWVQGIAYAEGARRAEARGDLVPSRPDAALPTQSRPTFDGADVGNVKDYGATGDGVTDDTAAIQAAVQAHTVVFLPFGRYVISDTITLKSNTAMVGEGYTLLIAKPGPAFNDALNPRPMILSPQDAAGTTRLTDFMITAGGDVPGCVLVEWGAGANSGIWDVMYRVEHTVYAQLHVKGVGGGYMESIWGWVADHDINTLALVTVQSPGGFLCTSSGKKVMIGTAFEHSSEYQYRLDGCSNIVLILTQTESPYWQNPPTAWGIIADKSNEVTIYGTGLYNWYFGNQASIFKITDSTNVNLYAVNTYHSVLSLDGDASIPANSVNQAFTANFMAYVHKWDSTVTPTPAPSPSPAAPVPSPAPGAPSPAPNASPAPAPGASVAPGVPGSNSTSSNASATIAPGDPASSKDGAAGKVAGGSGGSSNGLLIGLCVAGACVALVALGVVGVLYKRRKAGGRAANLPAVSSAEKALVSGRHSSDEHVSGSGTGEPRIRTRSADAKVAPVQ